MGLPDRRRRPMVQALTTCRTLPFTKGAEHIYEESAMPDLKARRIASLLSFGANSSFFQETMS